MRRRRVRTIYWRRRVAVGAVVTWLAAVVYSICDAIHHSSAAPSTSPMLATSPTLPAGGRRTIIASTTTSVPPATTAKVPENLSEPLRFGASGEEVTRLQDRLRVLGFEPGPNDGQFGTLTRQAVWAFEKLIAGVPAADATGVVTDELWQSMLGQGPIMPRRTFADGATTRRHTEVYLPEQVVAWFVDDHVVLISHMSSGSGERWRETVTVSPGEYRNEHGAAPIRLGLVGQSITPGGVYVYDRIVEGRRLGALGAMYDPAYFNFGIAIHGGDDVPLNPASHGCVRIPLYISDRFHRFIDRGDQVWVWDGENEPEWLGQVPPPFDQVDPNWSG